MTVSTIKSNLKLNDIENLIYTYMVEEFSSGKLSKGYEFGIKKFNAKFVDWCDKKDTVKAKAFPTVKNIENACKFFFLTDGKNFKIVPLIKVNSDGAIIVQVVDYDVKDFKIYTPKEKTKKTDDKEFNLIDTLENLSLLDNVSSDECKILENAIKALNDLKAKNASVLHKSA